MQIVDTDMPAEWLSGAQRIWITSVATEPSESGIVEPVERQTRPFLRFTFNVHPDDAQDYEDLYILVNGPARGFFCTPPLDRDHLVAGQTLGIATGSPIEYQLEITRGQTWNALYPIESSITVYTNGTPLVSPWSWTLGADGLITVTGPSSETITVDFQYKTAFRFVEESLVTTLDANGFVQNVQQVTIEEIP